MIRYVLDASVAVKWYLRPDEEPLADIAGELLAGEVRGELRFIVPDLFFAEFANTLRKAERQGRCDPVTTDRAVASILSKGLAVIPNAELITRATAISRLLETTVYDSIYVALATEAGGVLITADERLAHAAAAGAPVRWLGALR